MADRTNQGMAAVALRLAGASYAEIAEALAYTNPTTARTAVEQVLAARSGTPATREALRNEEAGRLERLLRSVWGKATDPGHAEHLPAAKVALSIIDRHVRLHGLDAPSEVIVHTPTMHEIDQWVAAVTQTQINDLRELEVDIIDAESSEADDETVDA